MKRVALALLFLGSALAWAEKPNPADFPIKVHVQASRLFDEVMTPKGPTYHGTQHLVAVIDGKTYELDGAADHTELLRVGDYKAKLVETGRERDYEYRRIYEFLFPDGKTRQFLVVGELE